MFICVCNAITERQVKVAVAEGASSLSDLQGQLGVAACCGCCAETAAEYLPGGQHHVPATEVHRAATGTVVGPAANDPALPVPVAATFA